jgi:hypothetical protein
MDNRRWFGLNLRKVKKKGAKRKPGKGTSKPGSAAAVGDAEDERACSDGSDEEQEGGRRARVLVPLANRDAEEIEEWDDWERSVGPHLHVPPLSAAFNAKPTQANRVIGKRPWYGGARAADGAQ